MKRLTIISLALLLVACNEKRVDQELIAVADQRCSTNGSLSYITDGEAAAETESCGYKCSRRTGKIEYSGTAYCRNGAVFKIDFAQ